MLYLLLNILFFIPNANKIIIKEQKIYNEILDVNNLCCHLQSTRLKLFENTIKKLNKLSLSDPYELHDLIAFRYVFYDKLDLLKFYHHICNEKQVIYIKNYIMQPKENGYSSIHLRYKNEYVECPVKLMECQLYLIEDYYNSLYGNASYYKYDDFKLPILY